MASASGVQPCRFLTLTGAPCASNNWMQSEWKQSFILYALLRTKCHIWNTLHQFQSFKQCLWMYNFFFFLCSLNASQHAHFFKSLSQDFFYTRNHSDDDHLKAPPLIKDIIMKSIRENFALTLMFD